MKFRHDFTQQWRVNRRDGACNLFDKFVADLPFFIPHRHSVECGRLGRLGNFDFLGHAAPRRFDRIGELV